MKGKKIDDNQKIPALAGEKWRTMTDKDKEKYKQQEAVAKKKHEAAMEEWRKKVSVFLKSWNHFYFHTERCSVSSTLRDAL